MDTPSRAVHVRSLLCAMDPNIHAPWLQREFPKSTAIVQGQKCVELANIVRTIMAHQGELVGRDFWVTVPGTTQRTSMSGGGVELAIGSLLPAWNAAQAIDWRCPYCDGLLVWMGQAGVFHSGWDVLLCLDCARVSRHQGRSIEVCFVGEFGGHIPDHRGHEYPAALPEGEFSIPVPPGRAAYLKRCSKYPVRELLREWNHAACTPLPGVVSTTDPAH